jgi:DNA polymerase (family 10)
VTRPEPTNAAIADSLQELGDLYELDGAIVHRVVAYRTAARAVRDATVSVAALARAGRATELPGVGATLQEKILAFVQTGTVPAAERLRAKFPPGLLEITHLPGLGPKRTRLLHSELGVDSLESLRAAVEGGRLRTVRGLGAKLEQNLAEALAGIPAGQPPSERSGGPPRLLLPRAIAIGETLIAGLQERGPAGSQLQLAGSIRRMADSVKDIDLVAHGPDPIALARALSELELIARAGAPSSAGVRGRLHSGQAVDVRIGPTPAFGNLLQHFTGSGAHNAALRGLAVRRGLHLSEHGILEDASGTTSACASESEVYGRLGLPYIEPELREDRGELERTLPALIERGDIRGDLHTHTTASDGHNTIEEMALAARALGYEYIAITDHSASHGFGADVSAPELARQIERVREVDGRLSGITVLAGSEVNVLPDGSLDYDEQLLARLDWVVASVHTAFGMSEQRMTERVIAAIDHPLVDVIGHPTGRLIERRRPYSVDLEALFAAAVRTGTMLEINANPDRRDLSEQSARAAAAAGVRLVIDSDAHRTATLSNMRWGLATARRAWLGPADIANTLPWSELSRLRKGARAAQG